MAQILENEPAWVERASKYDWHKWLDGQVWKLVKGEDFEVAVASFKQAAKQAAKSLGKELKMTSTDKHVIVKAFDPAA